MAKQGWELCKKSFNYEFRKVEPSNTIIKIDYRTFKNNRDFEDYLALFKDSRWEHISGSKYSATNTLKRLMRVVKLIFFRTFLQKLLGIKDYKICG